MGGDRLLVLPPRRLVAVVLRGPEPLECMDDVEGGLAGMALVINGAMDARLSSFSGGVRGVGDAESNGSASSFSALEGGEPSRNVSKASADVSG